MLAVAVPCREQTGGQCTLHRVLSQGIDWGWCRGQCTLQEVDWGCCTYLSMGVYSVVSKMGFLLIGNVLRMVYSKGLLCREKAGGCRKYAGVGVLCME